ncbi:MAG: tetratricopeptide repeat protein, partial [Planctomycetales bacterium]|nr:tetratricopeptide repeat protein [Planctomycetales bacterium]
GAAEVAAASRDPSAQNEQVARAHFQEGERRIRAGEYDEARASYEAAAAAFPKSPLQEDALFMMAETYFLEDKYPKAFTA